jgi:hypothetical protein
MSSPAPPTPSGRKLVWAPPELRAGIAQQIEPQQAAQRRRAVVVQAVVMAYFFTWLPAFTVFAVTTVVAPSVTNGAGVGPVAFWALQFSTLIAISAVVSALRLSATTMTEKAEETGRRTPAGRSLLRLAGQLLITGGCAAAVLALQGLSIWQIAVLASMLTAVLHLLPPIVARMLLRRRRRGKADPAP